MTNAGSRYSIELGSSDVTGLMRLVLEKSGAGYLYQSADFEVLLSGNLPDHFLQRDADPDIVRSQDDERLRSLKSSVLANGNPASLEIDVPSPSGILNYRIDLERVEIAGKKGILSVISDVSETRHRERVLKTLLRELSHRSKNLLAIIQGIATQTARQAFSLDSFLTKFRGRIQSLAFSQDLVTDSSWRGAYFFALADRQFRAYRGAQDTPFHATGINAHLSPNAALHIGLALHELIVNSASHGAIASGSKSLTLDCVETVLNDGPAIELAWVEQIPVGEKPREYEEQGFVRTVLERVVPVAIGGKSSYVTTPEHVEYRLTVPAREYEIITPVNE